MERAAIDMQPLRLTLQGHAVQQPHETYDAKSRGLDFTSLQALAEKRGVAIQDNIESGPATHRNGLRIQHPLHPTAVGVMSTPRREAAGADARESARAVANPARYDLWDQQQSEIWRGRHDALGHTLEMLQEECGSDPLVGAHSMNCGSRLATTDVEKVHMMRRAGLAAPTWAHIVTDDIDRAKKPYATSDADRQLYPKEVQLQDYAYRKAMCMPVTFQDLERDVARRALEEDAAEAMFRDKVVEEIRFSRFKPDEHHRRAIAEQASSSAQRVRQYNSDREVRLRQAEQRLASQVTEDRAKERSYKKMLQEVRSARGEVV